MLAQLARESFQNFAVSPATESSSGRRAIRAEEVEPLETRPWVHGTLIITTVLGCGVMPAGQAKVVIILIGGFEFQTVKEDTDLKNMLTTVFGVLEQQGRSAFLPDAIILSILDQLRVQINYDALECKAVIVIAGDPKSG
ncbi:hypothetical protein KIN20_014195 [Parelaphostrongylus tenuis]|uniref:Uncharacterized protein n=1 Tax=Parelaphostrongylus tenuis TaxID=148309 RepID=A0AAD5MGR6_PARTN|nr:hypothetical protein KIN20_014195 [Parelaphostrongylus tenuis]